MLDGLAEEFVERTRRGERPSITEYTRLHPEHAEGIRNIFPLLDAMETAKTDNALVGTRVGPYEIVREIGRGGMGVVYEAVQTDLGRRVALKVLPIQATLDSRFLERFRLEAQAAARLKHASIVPVIGYGTDGDLHYYSMQYIEGRGLDEVVAELRADEQAGRETRTRDDYRRIARIGLQLADAMAHAHAQGILHRDLKPTNVILDADEHAWITDFGLCHQTDSEGLTRTGDVVGTFRYMPPERFSGVSDVRGDLYGIGITLYELLTRKRAYEGDDPATLAARIPQQEPPRPRSVEPRVPNELDLIVRKAMAHDPAQRYTTAEALARDLRAFLRNQPIAARAPTFGYFLRKLVSRHRTVTATVCVALAVLLASTIWYVRDLQHKEARALRGQYDASVSAASAALSNSAVYQAASLLEEAPEDLRNWEWHHLRSRLHSELRTFESIPNRVASLSISPNGKRLATGFDKKVLVHDYESGTLLATLSIEAPAARLAWSPDGRRLAVGTWTGLEVWNWPEAEQLYRVTPGDHRNVAFADGGRTIVAAVVQGRIVRYDASNGDVIESRELAHRIVGMACDHPAVPGHIAIGTVDGDVSVRRLDTGELLWHARVARESALHLMFSTPRRLISAGDGKLLVWDAPSGQLLGTFGIGGLVGPLTRDPLGRRLLVHTEAAILVIDPETGRTRRTLSGRAVGHRAVVHPDGRRLVLGAESGQLHEWYLGDEGDPWVLERHMDDIITMDVHPGGRFIASGGFGGVLRVWDLDAGKLAYTRMSHHSQLESVRYSPDGVWLATAGLDGEIQVRRADAAGLTSRWQAAEQGAIRLAFLPEARGLVSYGRDGRVAVWSIPEGKLLRSEAASKHWGDYEGGFPQVAVSPDGRFIACNQPHGRIAVLDSRSLAVRHAIAAHEKPITGLDFHPHEPVLVSASHDRSLRLWSPETGASLGRHEPGGVELARDIGFNGVAYSPDGSRLATGSFRGALTIWDAEEIRPITSMDAVGWIAALRFTPDGSRLITGHSGGRLRIWDSVPVAQRVAGLQQAAAARAAAAPLVAELLEAHPHADAAIEALEARADLAPAAAEAARRILHERRASHEGLIARLWRDLEPPAGDPDRQRIALTIAEGLWRVSRHQNRPDARSDTLLALALLRAGQPSNALQIYDRIAARHEKRAPEMFAIDLCVAAIAHRAMERPEDTEAVLEKIKTLLAANPEVRTPRVLQMHAEATGK